MPTYLDRIIEQHRRRAGVSPPDEAALAAAIASAPPVRSFRAALLAAPGPIAVIAEVKRRSPSRGELAPRLDPAELARAYESGGAACLSVLTDEEFFGGSAEDLVAARAACGLPVLRKDFTVCEADLDEARAMGADAALLIVAALGDEELTRLLTRCRALGLDALVEVHDEEELRRALGAGADLIGVNQRDLHTFEVDTARAERVRTAVPAGVVTVAESGIGSGSDLARLAGAGFDAALVGERLVTAPDPAAALRELRGAGAGAGTPAVAAPAGRAAG